MKYYELNVNGYIISVGDSRCGTEITAERYAAVLDALRIKPPRTETTDYRLRVDLTWEEYPVDPPDPDPEIDDAELLNILMGGAE